MRSARHVTSRGEKRIAYKVLVEKSEGKRTLGRPRYRREDNIKMVFKKWDGVVWTGFVWLWIETSGGLL
jgi:hypothetical protein